MGSEWMQEYIAAKLVEVENALAELDARPDAVDRHGERQRLVDMGTRLMAALATYSDRATSTN